MGLFLFLLLFSTQKTFNHQKFSKNGKVASEAVFGPAFSEIRENESTENSEKKWKLISDSKTSGEIFTASFTDKYAQFRLAKTQKSTPRPETIVKKIENYIKRWTDAISFIHDIFSPGSFQLNSHQGPISGTIISWFAKNATGREFWTFCSLEKNLETFFHKIFQKATKKHSIKQRFFKVTKALKPDEEKMNRLTQIYNLQWRKLKCNWKMKALVTKR